MSKLPPALKALINAPSARPFPTPAPHGIGELYSSIARDAASRRVTFRPWLAISAATTFTLNSPESLATLYSLASSSSSSSPSSSSSSFRSKGANPIYAAELIREVGLKCISFNGIPRTINCLNAFRADLPASTTSQLCSTPSRALTPSTLGARIERGRALWDSVYVPLEEKLLEKLALAHPDLPLVILHGNYATLLSDPPPPPTPVADEAQHGGRRRGPARLGRSLTSLTAIACLRAQGGVAPQVVSHVFGLRKAVADGTYGAIDPEGDGVEEDEGVRWLASDEGAEWVLQTVDRIAQALRGSASSGARL